MKIQITLLLLSLNSAALADDIKAYEKVMVPREGERSGMRNNKFSRPNHIWYERTKDIPQLEGYLKYKRSTKRNHRYKY